MRWVTLVTLLGSATLANAQNVPPSGYEGSAESGGTFGTSGQTETTHQLGTTLPVRRVRARARVTNDAVDQLPEGSVSNPSVGTSDGTPIWITSPAR